MGYIFTLLYAGNVVFTMTFPNMSLEHCELVENTAKNDIEYTYSIEAEKTQMTELGFPEENQWATDCKRDISYE